MKFPRGVELTSEVPDKVKYLLDGTCDPVYDVNIKISNGTAFAGMWGKSYFVVDILNDDEVIFLAFVGDNMVSKMRDCINIFTMQGYTHFTAYTKQPKVARLFGRLGLKYRDIIMSNKT